MALSTLPDLHYQQVIDNLASIASNPARLPYLAVVGQGSIQVTDNGNSVMGVSFAAPAARGRPAQHRRLAKHHWHLERRHDYQSG